MIKELLFCTLAALMREGPISDALKECIKKDVNKAVKYLHEEGYAHRNIKSTTIFCDKCVFKLGYFDLCKVRLDSDSSVGTKDSSSSCRPHSSCTLAYSKKRGTKALFSYQKTDIYAFGVLDWYLKKEEEPFADLDESGVISELCNPNGRRLEIDPTWASDIKNQMIACLDECEEKRPSADELLTWQEKREIK